MPIRLSIAAAVLSLGMFASAIPAQSATESTKAAKAQLKRDHEAEKAQAKADKKQRKALNTHEQKEADKAQDKADRKAGAAPNQ